MNFLDYKHYFDDDDDVCVCVCGHIFVEARGNCLLVIRFICVVIEVRIYAAFVNVQIVMNVLCRISVQRQMYFCWKTIIFLFTVSGYPLCIITVVFSLQGLSNPFRQFQQCATENNRVKHNVSHR